MYGYKCECCDGIVREHVVEREVFKHRYSFVILENVPVGICDTCGNRYYHSSLLKRVDALATNQETPVRMEQVPVATFS